ncbi:metal tolerance protein 2 [Dioscorea cayenensis subsp. rotundata]|uniref:Metal tolerance protein 2 n=1 Tax=Dioscorea cayennensis subsp. rotundata TaxID=55577 RepID=A0AB40BNB0_DIOCR|nr:metal tolerance protein 2 [Dioscorea cayenensis subsp. rotundata]
MGIWFLRLITIHRACRPATSSPAWRHRPHGHLLPLTAERQNHRLGSRRWHMGHSHGSHSWEEGIEPDRVFRLGLAADVALTAGKTFAGYVTGSTAIIADAAHSLSDVVLSGVALWSFRAAKAPKDKEHPYGHGKFETLGTLGISSMLLVTAGGIAWHAVDILQSLLMSAPDVVHHANLDHIRSHPGHHHEVDLDHPALALGMMIISISVKEGLYWITKKTGEKEGSGLMQANAWHHRADAVSSVVALIGVGGAILGVPFLDPLAGLVVSGMILKAGIETGWESVKELVDAGVPQHVLAPIRQTITEVDGVKGCHRLRGRKAGSALYLDVHIEVDPFLSISAAHDIGENVRHHIQKNYNQVAEVFIHIDPSYSCCPLVDESKDKKAKEDLRSMVSVKQDADAVICNVISKLYAEKMSIEHMTRHSLKGKTLLMVQVSMPPDMTIRCSISPHVDSINL